MTKTKEQLELIEQLKLANANTAYYKGLFNRAQERINYLEKHCTELQTIIDRGYKQGDTFNPEHSGVYRIYNKYTGQSYVGQSSKDVYARCMSHYKPAEYSEDDWHYDLLNNPDSYEYEIIVEGVDNQGDLDRLEIYNIGKYHCLDEGYNKVCAAKFKFIEKYNSRTL